jgi:NAD(P)-dependent dehydrogenase (short-subunit alcohol dehydrogenase family)
MPKRSATIPAGRYGTAAEFGAACAFLLFAARGFIVGQNILLDGGANQRDALIHGRNRAARMATAHSSASGRNLAGPFCPGWTGGHSVMDSLRQLRSA